MVIARSVDMNAVSSCCLVLIPWFICRTAACAVKPELRGVIHGASAQPKGKAHKPAPPHTCAWNPRTCLACFRGKLQIAEGHHRSLESL